MIEPYFILYFPKLRQCLTWKMLLGSTFTSGNGWPRVQQCFTWEFAQLSTFTHEFVLRGDNVSPE